MMLRIAITGAAGRMGQRVVASGKNDPEIEIVAGLDVAAHSRIGEDIGEIAGIGKIGVALAAELDRKPDVLIDFSTAKATDSIVACCLERRIPLVLATTGLTPDQEDILRNASKSLPILWSPSMSMAVILTMKLAQIAAEALKDKDADVEIVERHHRYKVDAPSGTALKFGQLIAEIMGQTTSRHGREGKVGERPHGEIGYHAIRIGDHVGEHQIIFGMFGETLELSVKASNRDCYALGALAAAKFLLGKSPGLYNMNDVLGL
ncbi:MAG TPA: 4-hydroxy-tetrahydrodipicolinate reductase [Planctomycetaceae bacterium]|nr:4-hydroxy-tetrahydrodipicolinate reductase [Planctomycetaceae bacterium]